MLHAFRNSNNGAGMCAEEIRWFCCYKSRVNRSSGQLDDFRSSSVDFSWDDSKPDESGRWDGDWNGQKSTPESPSEPIGPQFERIELVRNDFLQEETINDEGSCVVSIKSDGNVTKKFQIPKWTFVILEKQQAWLINETEFSNSSSKHPDSPFFFVQDEIVMEESFALEVSKGVVMDVFFKCLKEFHFRKGPVNLAQILKLIGVDDLLSQPTKFKFNSPSEWFDYYRLFFKMQMYRISSELLVDFCQHYSQRFLDLILPRRQEASKKPQMLYGDENEEKSGEDKKEKEKKIGPDHNSSEKVGIFFEMMCVEFCRLVEQFENEDLKTQIRQKKKKKKKRLEIQKEETTKKEKEKLDETPSNDKEKESVKKGEFTFGTLFENESTSTERLQVEEFEEKEKKEPQTDFSFETIDKYSFSSSIEEEEEQESEGNMNFNFGGYVNSGDSDEKEEEEEEEENESDKIPHKENMGKQQDPFEFGTFDGPEHPENDGRLTIEKKGKKLTGGDSWNFDFDSNENEEEKEEESETDEDDEEESETDEEDEEEDQLEATRKISEQKDSAKFEKPKLIGNVFDNLDGYLDQISENPPKNVDAAIDVLERLIDGEPVHASGNQQSKNPSVLHEPPKKEKLKRKFESETGGYFLFCKEKRPELEQLKEYKILMTIDGDIKTFFDEEKIDDQLDAMWKALDEYHRSGYIQRACEKEKREPQWALKRLKKEQKGGENYQFDDEKDKEEKEKTMKFDSCFLQIYFQLLMKMCWKLNGHLFFLEPLRKKERKQTNENEQSKEVFAFDFSEKEKETSQPLYSVPVQFVKRNKNRKTIPQGMIEMLQRSLKKEENEMKKKGKPDPLLQSAFRLQNPTYRDLYCQNCEEEYIVPVPPDFIVHDFNDGVYCPLCRPDDAHYDPLVLPYYKGTRENPVVTDKSRNAKSDDDDRFGMMSSHPGIYLMQEKKEISEEYTQENNEEKDRPIIFGAPDDEEEESMKDNPRSRWRRFLEKRSGFEFLTLSSNDPFLSPKEDGKKRKGNRRYCGPNGENLVLRSFDEETNQFLYWGVHKEILTINSSFFYKLFKFQGKDMDEWENTGMITMEFGPRQLAALLKYIYIGSNCSPFKTSPHDNLITLSFSEKKEKDFFVGGRLYCISTL